jgi:hypothetical protein
MGMYPSIDDGVLRERIVIFGYPLRAYGRILLKVLIVLRQANVCY